MKIVRDRIARSTQEEKKELCEALGLNNIQKIKNNEEIVKEYASAGGHSVMNVIRFFTNNEIPYKQILIDITDKLYPSFGWTSYSVNDKHTEIEIENEIEKFLLERMEEKWESLSEEEKFKLTKKIEKEMKKKGMKQSTIDSIIKGIAGGGLAYMTATPLAMTIFYSSIFSSIWATIFGVSTFALATSVLLITGPLAVLIVGTPAYKKTIPATITLIRIRKRIEAEEALKKELKGL